MACPQTTALYTIGLGKQTAQKDTRHNQVLHTPETRFYKLRYLKDDQPIGLESEITKVVVDI